MASFSRIRSDITHFITSISVASTLQSVVIFAFIFTMSHYACVKEYAEYRKIFYIIDFTTAISLFGLNTLLLRKSTKSLYTDIVPTIFIINFIQCLVVLLFTLIQNLTLIVYLQIALFVALNSLYQICISIIVLKNARKLYFICTFVSSIVVFISLYLLVYLNAISFSNAYLLRIVVLLIFIIPFIIWTRNQLHNIQFPDFAKIKCLFLEASPIGLGVLLGSCTLYIDKFLASLMDDYQLAIYANASADIPFVGVAITTMSIFYLPLIHRNFIEKQFSKVCNNLSELFLFGWYLGVSVFTILFCNANAIVEILYSSRFPESVFLFRIFCCAYLFRIVSYTQIIVSLELENIIIKRMIGEMILQFMSSFIMFKYFGLIGLASSVILVLVLWSVPYNIRYFKKRLNCRYIDILPLRLMSKYFIKAFLPCFVLAKILVMIDCGKYMILAVTIVLYILINYRELTYIIKKIR